MEITIVHTHELLAVLVKDELADYYHKCKMAFMDFYDRPLIREAKISAKQNLKTRAVDAGIAKKLNARQFYTLKNLLKRGHE